MSLSRITAAQLEDQGYLINYKGANRYETTDVKSNCRCGHRRLGESGLGSSLASKRELTRTAAEMNAIEFGKRMLRQIQAEDTGFSTGNDDVEYVGASWISVFYQESAEVGKIGYTIVTVADLAE